MRMYVRVYPYILDVAYVRDNVNIYIVCVMDVCSYTFMMPCRMYTHACM